MERAGRASEAQRTITGAGGIALCASEDHLARSIDAVLAAYGYELTVHSGSVLELIERARTALPAVVLVALEIEPFSTSAQLRMLRGELGDVPVVVVATAVHSASARRVVRSDVDGIVHEAELERSLVPTIEAVLAHQLCVPAAMREAVAQPVFSYREKQVLELLVAGLTNCEIAGRLYLSESTVKSHLASSFRKLGVSSRGEAVRKVLDPDAGVDVGGASATHRTAPPSTSALR